MSEEIKPTITSEAAPGTPMVCVNHPNRPTSLRCNRCGDPICPECAVLTPTGYRCKKCVRNQQKVYVTALKRDYPISFFVAALLSFGGSYIASFLGFFTIFIAPVAGVIIAEAVRWSIKRRRGKSLFQVATAGAIAGALPLLLLYLIATLISLVSGHGIFDLLSLVWHGIYIFLVASTVYYRLSGITR